MAEHTKEQIAACERVMDGFEAQADVWADEIDLVLIIKNIGVASRGLNDRMPADVREGFINRQEANIDALVRQAYLEGFMRGGESRKAYDEAQIKEATDERDDAVTAADTMRDTIARAVWRYQMGPGTFDAPLGMMGDFIKRTCVDEAENIRRAIMGEPQLPQDDPQSDSDMVF